MKKIIIYLFSFFLFTFQLFSDMPDSIIWTAVGLGGGGGQYTPAISPIDSNLMFVSCDMGGVYRSTDKGKTWMMINFRQLKSSINCATVFHPIDRNIIWDESGKNLMKSTDAGETWFKVWDMPAYPKDMIIERGIDNPISMFIALGDEGLYKSNDGSNFTKVQNISQANLLDEFGKDIIVASNSKLWFSDNKGEVFTELTKPDLDNPNGIIDIQVNGGDIFVLENNKLWKSTNQGSSWSVIANSEGFDRGIFRFVRAEKNYVWLTTAGGGKFQSTALLSTDEGNNFKPVFFCNDSWDDTRNLNNGWLSLDFNCGWGGPAIGFNISQTNPETAIWTDAGRSLMTTNAGETWDAVYTKFADKGQREAGKLWQSRGLEVTSSWDIYIPDDNNDFINVAYTDIGGAYSQDGANTWRSTFDGGIPGHWRNTTYNFAYDKDNKTLWGAFSGRHDIPGGWSANNWQNEGRGGVAYSKDGGMHWTALTDNGLIDKPVTSIAIDLTSPINSRRLFASVWSDGVWRSEDGGVTWERTSVGLDCGDGNNSSDGPNTHIVEVQVHPDGSVFALKTKYIRDGYKIKNDAGLWKSVNHGDSWEFISSNVADCPPNNSIDLNGEHSWADAISFLLDENDVNHIYVGAQNVNNGKVQGGLYETTDGGDNWTRIYQTYAAFRLTKSKYDKNRMYLATSGEGVLISDDMGKNWKQIENFPFAHTTRITEDPIDSNLIWVNTFGGGVWKGEIINNTTNVDFSNRKEKNKIEIYPNPFSSLLSINALGSKRIEIYDLLGKKIFDFAGDRCIFIPDNKINNDIYFVRVVYNKFVKTKIVVLQK